MNMLRIALAMPTLIVGDCDHNANEMIHCMQEAIKEEVSLLVFPELSITGASCGDLFFDKEFHKDILRGLDTMLEASKNSNVLTIFGTPLFDKASYNAVVAIRDGSVVFVHPKPVKENRLEARYFDSFIGESFVYGIDKKTFDIAFDLKEVSDADLLLWYDNKNYVLEDSQYNKDFARMWTKKNQSTLLYMPLSSSESSTDFVFSGESFICHHGDMLISQKMFFQTSKMSIVDIDTDTWAKRKNRNITFELPIDYSNAGGYYISNSVPFLPRENRSSALEEIVFMQVAALKKRIEHVKPEKLILGVSGGLDASLTYIVALLTLDILQRPRTDLIGITMPGFGTSNRTLENAHKLMDAGQVTKIEKSIVEASQLQLDMLDHDGSFDTTFENVQARERTLYLLNMANKEKGLVLGTGDFSELALGYATFGGDHLSHYNVNVNVPKTVIRLILRLIGENDAVFSSLEKEVRLVLLDILDTPISPELLPPGKSDEITQKTEEIVGAYELIDFILYNKIAYGMTKEKILFLATLTFQTKYAKETISFAMESLEKRFIKNQFKRNCLPDGPQIFPISLSPRQGMKLPSDISKS